MRKGNRVTSEPAFTLRFPMEQLPLLIARYAFSDEVPITIGRLACERGYLQLDEFLALSDWKFPGGQQSYRRNSEESVRRRTQESLATNDEKLAITSLMLLNGVSWTMGSV